MRRKRIETEMYSEETQANEEKKSRLRRRRFDGEKEPVAVVTGFPCDACGHQMIYSPERERLFCTYCKTEKEIPGVKTLSPEYLYDPENDKWDTPDWREYGNHVLLCPSCGAETLVPVEAVTATCPFCQADYVTETPSSLPVIPPETMLPFTVAEEEARQSFLTYAKRRLYAPFGFKKKISAVKMSGIYLPAFTFDTDTVTKYSGQGGRYRTETYTTRVNGKTVTRTRTVTHWYPISGTAEESLDDILLPASMKVDAALFGKIAPFSTKTMHTYNPAYLAGFFAERYSIGPGESFQIASQTAYRSMEEKIREDRGYDTYSMMQYHHSFKRVRFKHILLPVWFASYHYGRRKYSFLVNGETGRVAGKTPLSKLKILLTALAGVLVAVGIAYLIIRSELGM